MAFKTKPEQNLEEDAKEFFAPKIYPCMYFEIIKNNITYLRCMYVCYCC